MRGALRAYRLLSSVALGLWIVAVLASGTLYVVAPEKLGAMLRKASAELVQARDQSREAETPAIVQAQGARAPASGQPSRAPSSAPEESRAARCSQDPERPEIDLQAFEARLRHLEGAAPGVAPRAPGSKPDASAVEKLAAWESLRLPLLDLVRAAAPRESSAPLSPIASIESLAPQIVARLEELSAEQNDSRSRIVEGLLPSTLARLLVEEQAISDERAVGLLRRLGTQDARAALERLSRWSPRRAARLLEGLGEDREIGSSRVAREGEVNPGSGDESGKGRLDG